MTQAFLKPLSWNESQSIGKSLKKERNWCLNHVNILSGSKVMTKNRHQNMYICIFFGPIYQNGHQIVKFWNFNVSYFWKWYSYYPEKYCTSYLAGYLLDKNFLGPIIIISRKYSNCKLVFEAFDQCVPCLKNDKVEHFFHKKCHNFFINEDFFIIFYIQGFYGMSFLLEVSKLM